MAKKAAKKTVVKETRSWTICVKETRSWNVWVECDSSKKGYFSGRDTLENRCGESSGSGTGGSGWDVSWHGLKTEAEAKTIAKKAARFGFVDSVRYYQDQDENGKWGIEVYLKGEE